MLWPACAPSCVYAGAAFKSWWRHAADPDGQVGITMQVLSRIPAGKKAPTRVKGRGRSRSPQARPLANLRAGRPLVPPSVHAKKMPRPERAGAGVDPRSIRAEAAKGFDVHGVIDAPDNGGGSGWTGAAGIGTSCGCPGKGGFREAGGGGFSLASGQARRWVAARLLFRLRRRRSHMEN